MQEWIQTLIQGGAVGISFALIILLYKISRMFNVTLNNHLIHQEKVHREVAKSNIKLAKAIQLLADNIRNCKYNKRGGNKHGN